MANEVEREPEFCLRWNNYESNFCRVLESMLRREVLVDVTLCCEGRTYRAHKAVLSDVKAIELEALIQYIYTGQITLCESQLPGFLKLAEQTKIRGLAKELYLKEHADHVNCRSAGENKEEPTTDSPVADKDPAIIQDEDSASKTDSETEPAEFPESLLSDSPLEAESSNVDNASIKSDDEDALTAATWRGRRNTAEASGVCSVCNCYRYDLAQHMKQHAGLRHKCAACPRSYSLRKTLNQHIKRHHPTIASTTTTQKKKKKKKVFRFKCKLCLEECPGMAALRRHVLQHHAPPPESQNGTSARANSLTPPKRPRTK